MILRVSFMMAIILSTALQVEAGVWDRLKSVFVSQEKENPATIKVLIAHDIPFADVEVKGSYNLYDPYKNKRLETCFSARNSRLQAIAIGMKWGEEFPGVFQLEIIPDSNEIVTTINGKDYHGKIYVYDVGGSISIVNEVEIEDYLSATLSRRLTRTLSEEGMAAAAITERTYAFFSALNAENPYWHVRAEDVSYLGVNTNTIDPQLVKALASTRHMVMSKTGIYEGVVTPYPVALMTGKNDAKEASILRISADDLDRMARSGDNAAKILAKTCPEANIALTISPCKKTEQVAEIQVSEVKEVQAR